MISPLVPWLIWAVALPLGALLMLYNIAERQRQAAAKKMADEQEARAQAFRARIEKVAEERRAARDAEHQMPMPEDLGLRATKSVGEVE